MRGSQAHHATYRRLVRADAASYAAHLQRLDGADRVARFMAARDADSVRQHVRKIRWDEAIIVGCFLDGTLRGAAELHPTPGAGRREAELAFSVEGPFQGHGLGTELVRRALAAARNRMIASVWMVCLATNARVRHIVTKLGGRLAFEDGDISGRIALEPMTLETITGELLDDAQALGRQLADAAERLTASLGWPRLPGRDAAR